MPEALCPCPAGLRRDADRPACVNALLSPCPGGIRTSEAAILPYVPYPTCLATGSLPATRLPVLQPRRTSQSGALMTDPITGIEVPVLAVTLHPQTRQWLTLGGAYRNPLTQTLAPLELGGPMEDPVTGGISPILGVGLDENTGLLVARVPSFCPSSLWSGFPSPSPQHPLYKTLEGSTGPSWVKQCGQGGQGLLLAGLCEAWSEQIPRGRDMGGWDGNGCWWARGLLCLQMEKSIMVKFL